jgi:hypothetical protein
MGINVFLTVFMRGPIQPNQIDHRYTLSGPEWTDQPPSKILVWVHQATWLSLHEIIAGGPNKFAAIFMCGPIYLNQVDRQ